MLKVRLMGTKRDIIRFEKLLRGNKNVQVTEKSDMYPNKGTNRFYRAYMEINQNHTAEK